MISNKLFLGRRVTQRGFKQWLNNFYYPFVFSRGLRAFTLCFSSGCVVQLLLHFYCVLLTFVKMYRPFYMICLQSYKSQKYSKSNAKLNLWVLYSTHQLMLFALHDVKILWQCLGLHLSFYVHFSALKQYQHKRWRHLYVDNQGIPLSCLSSQIHINV